MRHTLCAVGAYQRAEHRDRFGRLVTMLLHVGSGSARLYAWLRLPHALGYLDSRGQQVGACWVIPVLSMSDGSGSSVDGQCDTYTARQLC